MACGSVRVQVGKSEVVKLANNREKAFKDTETVKEMGVSSNSTS